MLECLKIESSYVYKYVWNFPNVIYTSMQLLIIEINIFKSKNSMKKSTDFWRKVLIFLSLKFFFSNVGMFKNWIFICIQIRMKLSECAWQSTQLLIIEINIFKSKNSMKKIVSHGNFMTCKRSVYILIFKVLIWIIYTYILYVVICSNIFYLKQMEFFFSY